jgi:PAS domain S-box-containing protein
MLRGDPVLRYGLAVVAVAISTAVGLWLRPGTYITPYLLFYPAVLVSVWFGGLGAGLLATVLSATVADYLFIRPYYTLLTTVSDIVRMVYFCISFGLICWMIEHRRLRTESQIVRQVQLLEMSFSPIIVRDSQDRITFWNRGAERLYGWTEAEALGQVTHKLLQTVFPYPLERIVGDLKRAGTWEGELVHTGKNGKTVVVISRWTLQQSKGVTTAVTEANFDLTQLKEKEAAQEALFRSEKLASAGRLAAVIAHETNNPLCAATNLLYIVAGDPGLPERLREYVKLANNELERIAHISRQTLSYYRESSTPKSVDVTALLDNVVNLFGKTIERKQIRIERHYADHVSIPGHEGELRQVFANLMTNSIEALPHGGMIKLRVSIMATGEGKRRVRITVADNGQGIDPDARPRIFEPFFTTKRGTGTGLGLWVAQQIVQKHHGSVRVRSKHGGEESGTVFSVVLPAVQGQAAKHASAGSSL